MLYLVAGTAEPPVLEDCLQDWVRVPAPGRDLEARSATLDARLWWHGSPPVLDDDGWLHHRGHRVELPRALLPAVRLLVDACGRPVADDELAAALQVDSLRRPMSAIRRLVRDAALTLQRDRSGGYSLRSSTGWSGSKR